MRGNTGGLPEESLCLAFKEFSVQYFVICFVKNNLKKRVAAVMSGYTSEEFVPISEEASDKEKPERKGNNPNLRTNVFQEEWCVGKNSEAQGVTSTERNELSSEVDHNADDIGLFQKISTHTPWTTLEIL